VGSARPSPPGLSRVLGRLHSALGWPRKRPWVLGSSEVWLGMLLWDVSPGQRGLCTQRELSSMERALDTVPADRLSSRIANPLRLCWGGAGMEGAREGEVWCWGGGRTPGFSSLHHQKPCWAEPPRTAPTSPKPHTVPESSWEVTKTPGPPGPKTSSQKGRQKCLLQPGDPYRGTFMDAPTKNHLQSPCQHSPPTGCSRISAGLWGFSPSAESGVLARPGGERTVGTGGNQSVNGEVGGKASERLELLLPRSSEPP